MLHIKQTKKKEVPFCKLVSIEDAGSFGENFPYTMLTFNVSGKLEKHGLSDGNLLSLIKKSEDNCFKH